MFTKNKLFVTEFFTYFRFFPFSYEAARVVLRPSLPLPVRLTAPNPTNTFRHLVVVHARIGDLDGAQYSQHMEVTNSDGTTGQVDFQYRRCVLRFPSSSLFPL